MAETSGKRPGSLRPGWARPEHPVFGMETGRRTASGGLNALREGCLPLTLAAAGLAALVLAALILPEQIGYGIESMVTSLLAALLGVLLLLQVLAGAFASGLTIAQTAPTISGEVELQSWGLLRVTTLSLREIILAKFAAALSQLRGALAGLLVLRAASTITALLLLGYLLRSAYYYDPRGWMRMIQSGTWILPTLAGLVFLLWYAGQPLIQLLLNGSLGMATSALARSRGQAIAAGLAARLVLWIGSILINAGLIYGLGWLLIENWASPYRAPLEFFRGRPQPSDQTIAAVLSLTAILYVIIVFVAQTGLLASALQVAQRRAGRPGGRP